MSLEQSFSDLNERSNVCRGLFYISKDFGKGDSIVCIHTLGKCLVNSLNANLNKLKYRLSV